MALNLQQPSLFTAKTNPSLAGKFSSDFSNSEIGAFDFENLILKLPKDQQEKARVRLIESQIEAEATRQAIAPLIPQQQSLEELGKFRENEARLAQQLGKESLWQTGAAYALFKGIPQTITSAFARTAEANREAGYAIPRAYADTFRALSRGPY